MTEQISRAGRYNLIAAQFNNASKKQSGQWRKQRLKLSLPAALMPEYMQQGR
jgi:hypothetical protein